MARIQRQLQTLVWLAGVMLAVAVPGASVQADGLDGAPTSEQPTSEQMVEQLRPHSASRGLVIGGAATLAPALLPTIDLAVSFEFNSARLTADAELLLDRLGKALRDPALAESRFGIAGNTDAVGGAGYNQRLSEDRARAVKHYLVEHYGIAEQRLSAVGYGSSRPLDPQHPKAALNRRVEVSNLGRGG
jgi:outer membrane protein OmpA-like peptidoglycan-associated protein